jgi:hypothetical protein
MICLLCYISKQETINLNNLFGLSGSASFPLGCIVYDKKRTDPIWTGFAIGFPTFSHDQLDRFGDHT